VEEVARIVAEIRTCWPFVRILLRADSGFAREALMAWREENRVDYLFGLARNALLVAMIEAELAEAKAKAERSGRAARRFKDFKVEDAQELEPQTSRHRQGRVNARRSQSALY
jgi:hypothetical protein